RMAMPLGLEVEDVRMADGSPCYFSMEDQVLTLSWFSLDGLALEAGDDILRLQLQVRDASSVEGFSLMPGTVFGSFEGQEMPGVKVELPGIAPLAAGFDLWPNPATHSINLWISLPDKGRVKAEVVNMLGQATGIQGQWDLQAGEHRLVLPLQGLAEGSYLVRLTGEGSSAQKPLVVVR
ncbi:MAG TPA: T9SS type A sorting domain-containing protein, partial [Bacteroidales bacterium]|nr:T9SS type A sorting domain-containing protein [Bacteroidales bacterium]